MVKLNVYFSFRCEIYCFNVLLIHLTFNGIRCCPIIFGGRTLGFRGVLPFICNSMLLLVQVLLVEKVESLKTDLEDLTQVKELAEKSSVKWNTAPNTPVLTNNTLFYTRLRFRKSILLTRKNTVWENFFSFFCPFLGVNHSVFPRQCFCLHATLTLITCVYLSAALQTNFWISTAYKTNFPLFTLFV